MEEAETWYPAVNEIRKGGDKNCTQTVSLARLVISKLQNGQMKFLQEEVMGKISQTKA